MTQPTSPPVAAEALPPNVLTLWRVGAALPAGVVLVAGVAAGLASGTPILALAGVAAAAVVGALGLWVARLQYDNWRWGLDDRWIEIRHGVVVHTGQIVPRTRVQTLTTRTGPLDRWLGLTTVVVHTAGTHTPNLVVPHIDDDAVARLQEELAG